MDFRWPRALTWVTVAAAVLSALLMAIAGCGVPLIELQGCAPADAGTLWAWLTPA